jgi:general secretion pathway protein E
LSQQVRSLIQGSTDAAVIDRVAIQTGMTTMLDDGVAKCRSGAASVAEVLRVTTVR